jgi:hypothetical protein
MSAALLLLALGSMPGLPDELGRFPEGAGEPRPLLHTVDGIVAMPDRLPDLALPPGAEPEADPAAAATPPPAAAVPAPPPPAPRATEEASRYRVRYGVFGELGQVQITFRYPGVATENVRAVGEGSGSLLGMGQYHKRVEAELDPRALAARRWTTSRVQSGKTTTDSVEQTRPGSIQLVRRRTGKPDEGWSFDRQQVVLDPLSFLYRLRARPPRARELYEVLDGRALWLITVEPATAATLDGRGALALRGRANPVFWDGQPDKERTARSFTLWLEDDRFRTPLRLVMPLAVGEVRVDLTGVDRPVEPLAPAQARRPPRVRPALARGAR